MGEKLEKKIKFKGDKKFKDKKEKKEKKFELKMIIFLFFVDGKVVDFIFLLLFVVKVKCCKINVEMYI